MPTLVELIACPRYNTRFHRPRQSECFPVSEFDPKETPTAVVDRPPKLRRNFRQHRPTSQEKWKELSTGVFRL